MKIYKKPEIKAKKVKLNSFLNGSRSGDSFSNLNGSPGLIAQGTLTAPATDFPGTGSGGTNTYATTGT